MCRIYCSARLFFNLKDENLAGQWIKEDKLEIFAQKVTER